MTSSVIGFIGIPLENIGKALLLTPSKHMLKNVVNIKPTLRIVLDYIVIMDNILFLLGKGLENNCQNRLFQVHLDYCVTRAPLLYFVRS